mmetsp:Transcript_31066/g.28256  ORF Transcript_31066/g.28256 Transcript_31066/m.28256 type:complete len:199 (+) Transcript_31066:505-1101(+)
MAFLKFHSLHHNFLGLIDRDCDMPCEFEIKYFRGPFAKVIQVITLIAWYIVRPYCQNYKTPSMLEVFNIAVIIVWDIFILYFFGVKALFYLVISTISAAGPHPCGIHYFAEHFEFVNGQDTYSYYGPINKLSLNVGYHVEHHDFPNVPWTKLPELKAMAPEFYDNLPYHGSYFKLLWRYINDNTMGPWSRISRHIKGE